MIGYEKFGALNLSDFLIGQMRAEAVEDWEFLNLKWRGEVIGFTQWLQLQTDPGTLRCISLDLVGLPPRVSQAILGALELRLQRGMSLAEVVGVLGKYTKRKTIGGKERGYFETGGAEPFKILCTFNGSEGLVYVTVTRDSGLSFR